jgi:hypothetical protein
VGTQQYFDLIAAELLMDLGHDGFLSGSSCTTLMVHFSSFDPRFGQFTFQLETVHFSSAIGSLLNSQIQQASATLKVVER